MPYGYSNLFCLQKIYSPRNCKVRRKWKSRSRGLLSLAPHGRPGSTGIRCGGRTLRYFSWQAGRPSATRHTKLSTTLKIYTLPVPSDQRAAVKTLAQMVTNGESRTSACRDCCQQHSEFNELNGRPEWTRTIDLFRVKGHSASTTESAE